MKINRESRTTAKKLFHICRLPEGGVDESKVREVIAYVEKTRIRNAAAIMTRLHKLISLEIEEHSAVVESPLALSGADQKAISEKLSAIFGASTDVTFSERRGLLGGIRIKCGSSVWDGSVLGRLNELQKEF